MAPIHTFVPKFRSISGMKLTVPLALVVAIIAGPSLARAARHKSIEDQLMKLDPQTRAEQRCNGRLAGLSIREHKGFNTDEVVAYAFADSTLKGSVVSAPCAALRSHGRWYHVSYICTVSPDGLNIESFSYKLGDEVPREQWAEHYLVP
jgi:hypothetical protein